MENPPVALAAPATEALPASDSPCESLPVSFERRAVRFRQARIELLLVPGGRLRRFVVLESERLRVALGQPKRREITPLNARQEHFEFSTKELWTLGEHQANASLRLLYARLGEQEVAAMPASQPRQRLTPPIGQILEPQSADGFVRGKLLYAGPSANEMFCIELLEDERRVRSIAHMDLARALQAADANVGDMIRIERAGSHAVSIREERSGTHGEGNRTLQRQRETFTITKETLPEAASDRTLQHRSLRSASSAP